MKRRRIPVRRDRLADVGDLTQREIARGFLSSFPTRDPAEDEPSGDEIDRMGDREPVADPMRAWHGQDAA